MTPRRIDRAAIRSRLEDVACWIVEALLDAFEAAALAAMAASEKKKKPGDKPGSSPAQDTDHD
jgi:hypothetical protein